MKYLKVAEAASAHSDHERIHIGACVVSKKEVVGIGFNKIKTSPIQMLYNRLLPYEVLSPRLHAEMDALIKAGNKSSGGTLYVFRRGLDNVCRNCRPCSACYGSLKDAGIRRVVYTTVSGIMEMCV